MSRIPTPPVAKKIPHQTRIGDHVIDDDYFWLREKENPEVIALLQAENTYTDEILGPLAGFREKLFQEMKGRIKEDDQEVPVRDGDWFYYSRMQEGAQYAIHCRKKLDLSQPEEILLDGNVLAQGKSYFRLGSFEVSSNHEWLAYAADYNGSEHFTIYFKNLVTGELLDETIPDTSAAVEWAESGLVVFYTVLDSHDRPDRVFRHELKSTAKDELIYQESDSRFFVDVSKSRSKNYLFISTEGKTSSEIYYLQADQPMGKFKVIEPRRDNVLYEVTHHGAYFYIITNDGIENFKLVSAPVQTPQAKHWRNLRSGSSTLYIESAEAFKSHLVVRSREKGLPQIRVFEFGADGALDLASEHLVEFLEPVYALGMQNNPDFGSEVYRFGYTSMVTPNTVLDYNMRLRTREVKKVQEIPSGYDPALYKTERLFAQASDGTEIPISLVYRINRGGGRRPEGITSELSEPSNPLLLYGYGSYGYSVEASFTTTRLSLLDRGFVVAMAHIRGGTEMGRSWYENGKFLKKKNTFTDFIACAEHLIGTGHTRPGEIVIHGGSAGGMLVGAAINMRPELFRACVANVPFVDVLNTMLDETLPLTPTEFDEWGNPKDPVYFEYIKSYSPYDNVERKRYPHILVTSGLNDPRVTYWEPAKWVAKLREMKTDQNLLLQHIHMGAGHGGPSGRYASLHEVALIYAFIFHVFGKI